MPAYQELKDSEEVARILPRISLFGGLDDEQFQRLRVHLAGATASAGETIARQGQTATHIHIILSGRVDLMISRGSETLRKRGFSVGDCFGEAALLSLVNNSASFVAVEETRLAALSLSALRQLHSEEPDIFTQIILNIARDLARKLQYTDELLLRLGHGFSEDDVIL